MHTTRPSRLSIDPTTNLPSIHSFGELSQFLRGSVADEECRELSDSLAQLAARFEGICDMLRIDRDRGRNAPELMDLLTVLREHRNLVVNLSASWRGLYEYAAYLQALNNFRVLIGQWLLQTGPGGELPVTAEDFELIAWRTLGEGTLMIDMYEQLVTRELSGGETASTLAALEEPQVQRAMAWWKKLRL